MGTIRVRHVALAGFLVASLGCGGDGSTAPSTGPAPTITEVEPAVGTVGTELRLDGSNFRSGARVFVGDHEATSPEVVSSSLLVALVPAGVPVDEPLDVVARNSDGTEVGVVDAFTAVAPDLQFVNGATKPSGKVGSTVVLEGTAFGDVQGEGEVLFSDGAGGTVPASITSEDDWTDTFILTIVPSGAESGDVVVVTSTGTSEPLTFTVTQEATFSPSVVDWQQTTALPAAVSGHAALFVLAEDDMGQDVRRVYVIGGADGDGTGQTSVWLGDIESDATVASWAATASLPAGRAFHAAVAATPFNARVQEGWIYALGGVEFTSGAPLSSVLRAPIQSDGSLGSWSEVSSLPEPLRSVEAVVFQSRIYVVGGATTDDVSVSSVYRAAIDTLGNVGSWETLTSLPEPRANHALTLVANCLHLFGGDDAGVLPGDPSLTSARYPQIHRARIDLRTRDLTSAGWSLDDTETVKARRSHTSVIAGGGVLNTAGLYDGIGTSGSSENMFAQVGADCDVDSFGGANNQNSIKQNGGANLFDHAAISFVDGSGTSHVMILGGDDVDQPGQKQSAVWVF